MDIYPIKYKKMKKENDETGITQPDHGQIKLKWWQTALIVIKNILTTKNQDNVQKKQRGNKNV